MLWTLGLPSGLLLIILNRWIPESPRFLLANGRVAEAHAVMARYWVEVRATPAAGPAPAPVVGGLRAVFHRPYTSHTLTVLLYGIAWA